MLEKPHFTVDAPLLKCCFSSIMNIKPWLSGLCRKWAGAGWISLGGLFSLWLTGCAGPGGALSPSMAPKTTYGEARSAENRREEARPAEERPGLATGFGKRIRDEWQQQSFVRASNSPAGTSMVFYNDKEGIKAMTGYRYRGEEVEQAAGGLVEWGIKGGMGFLPVHESGGKRFVEGRAGAAYSLWIKNRCRSRVEVVLSVDGLDVIDGKSASFAKRGYVIAPGETLEVKGWRTGWDSVARFEFSSVGASYANQRHGDARNVGVVGMAVFGEKGVDPWKWMPREVNTRQTANPFATER
jgi:hypothetical protein